jgi:hypothetical protein
MPTLHIIQNLDDPRLALLADDPVRPEIPAEFRVSASSAVYVLLDDSGSASAVVCAAFRCMIPSTVMELVLPPESAPTVAVFYTIWSYVPGAGRRLISAARSSIQAEYPEVVKFVTLSPPTDMARVFHLRNGAEVFRVNPDTVNYLYP